MEHQSREQRTLHSKEQFLGKFFEAARAALMERPAKPKSVISRVRGLRRLGLVAVAVRAIDLGGKNLLNKVELKWRAEIGHRYGANLKNSQKNWQSGVDLL